MEIDLNTVQELIRRAEVCQTCGVKHVRNPAGFVESIDGHAWRPVNHTAARWLRSLSHADFGRDFDEAPSGPQPARQTLKEATAALLDAFEKAAVDVIADLTKEIEERNGER